MINPAYPLNRDVSSKMLADPEATATALHTILMAAYGDALYGSEDTEQWDPVLLWRQAREDFSITIPEENENKINALMLAISTDVFYAQEEPFVAICLALYHGDMGDIVAGFMEDLTLPEALWGIFEVALNRDDDMEFSRVVEERIKREMREEAEDDDYDFTYFERELIDGKTQLIAQMRILDVSNDLIAQIRNFDETPIHDENGNLVTPNGSRVHTQ